MTHIALPGYPEGVAGGRQSSDTCPVKQILMIDDDSEMVSLLAHSLAPEGLELSAASSGEEGIEQLRTGNAELVLLDVNLPDISGFEVLRRIRRESDVAVIMLTARGEEIDRVVGLEIGADDYLAKPFSVRELVARISAILRRVAKSRAGAEPSEAAARELKHGSIWMDLLTRCVKRDGQLVSLTGAEYELLRVLMESAGTPVKREELSRSVFDREHAPFDRSVDNLVSTLRQKLGATRDGRERIKSIRGVGYVYIDLDVK